jgi:transcription initiation factor TFIIE subunit beta
MSTSYLEKQQSLFKASLSSASSKLANKKAAASASTTKASPPSPATSIGSTTSRNDAGTPSTAATGTKRKRQDIVYSQPETTGSGTEIGTNVVYALHYLQGRQLETKTVQAILGHLSLLTRDDVFKEQFVENLRLNPQVEFHPAEGVTEQKWHSGHYQYRPKIPGVRDKASLLKFLQMRRESNGVEVKHLKDGWSECEAPLGELEGQHKILLIRTKKEGVPKHVYPDDPALTHGVEDEFKKMWMRVAVPKVDELPRKLVAVGQKPASADPTAGGAKAPVKKKEQKRRAARKMGKVTNAHMQDILKDFSGARR